MAILYAILSLVSASCNDFLFSRVSRNGIPRGLFILVIGLVSLLAFVFVPWDAGCSREATWVWGAISGFFSLTANILLIEAMRLEDASLCSTIYRMNLLVVVLWATLFLGESLQWQQWLGVCLTIGAILAFMPGGLKSRQGATVFRTGFLLALLACLLRGGMGLAYKYGFAAGADRSGILALTGVAWILGGALYGLWRDRPYRRPDGRTLLLSIVSGGLVVGITFFMAAALQCGQASVVMPIANMSFIGTLLLNLAAGHEKLTARKTAAALCGAAAILLLTT